MASQGPLYPGTITTEIGPSGDNDWLTPENIGADDGSEAQITAPTYDAGDHSYRLKAQNLGFTVPTSSTIDGIVVEIDRRAFAGAAQDQEVRLYNESAVLVGDDKQTATAWPATLTIDTYGSSSDTWTASPTPTMVNDPDFGVALIVLADAANTDIGVDFIRVTVYYTLTPVIVTPGTASLTLATFAPSVATPRLVTPGVASLTTARFAPTVTATANQLVTPGVASLSLTAFTPTVATPRLVTPGIASLVLTAFAPTVTAGAGIILTPGIASLVTTRFAPTVTATANVVVIPGIGALVLTGFAPTVSVPRLVTPGVASLLLAAFAPTVTAGIPDTGGIPPTLQAPPIPPPGGVATHHVPES